MVLMALRAMTAHILSQICAVVFTLPLTSRLCSQLQELQELPTSPLRMWSSSKKHQLILTLAPGPGVEPGSRGHKADALPLSYPHIQIFWGLKTWNIFHHVFFFLHLKSSFIDGVASSFLQ